MMVSSILVLIVGFLAITVQSHFHSRLHSLPSPHLHNEYLYTKSLPIEPTIFNVLDYGALNNDSTECMFAFQTALNAAGVVNGGIVYAPAGTYAFLTSAMLTIPKGVTLMGSDGNVPYHSNNVKGGTILAVKGGRQIDEGCFVQLTDDSTLTGLTIFYPDQNTNKQPVPYPWSVCLTGNNPAVTDIECLNCWDAIKIINAKRHYVARIQGQPTNTGVYLENTEYGRLEDVNFTPRYSTYGPFMNWQLHNGRSFVFSGCAWEHVHDLFSSGYAIGYHFTETTGADCYGSFVGIGADMTPNASVQIDTSSNLGLMITNGQFTAYRGPNFGSLLPYSSQVVISNTNKGEVHFINSGFWGPSNNIARISGSGTTLFSQCVFEAWDHIKKGNSAIKVEDEATGNLIIEGNNFQFDGVGPQVDLGNAGNLSKAVIIGNVIKGTAYINGKAMNTQIGLNSDDTFGYTNLNLA